ncbi:MAG: hypothetical protein LC804_24155 [Acidobacteria bacterium]|nr:hypothetical protein [Acidobacteriota bacterium]
MKAAVALGIMLVADAAWAQTPPRAASMSEPQYQRRYQIKVMEGVLVGAVQHGAEQMGRQMQTYAPNLILMSGTARARGFVLEGYGVFFDVDIPAIRQSVAWTMRTMERDLGLQGALRELRQHLQTVPDPQQRVALEQALRRLELQVGSPAARLRAPADQRQTVRAAGVLPDTDPLPAAAPPLDDDPNQLYESTVKSALIDAMLDHSGPMAVRSDEWLTVAARDNAGPLMPGEVAVTLILRIRGSDLAEFLANRLTRDETRKRVEVREF